MRAAIFSKATSRSSINAGRWASLPFRYSVASRSASAALAGAIALSAADYSCDAPVHRRVVGIEAEQREDGGHRSSIIPMCLFSLGVSDALSTISLISLGGQWNRTGFSRVYIPTQGVRKLDWPTGIKSW